MCNYKQQVSAMMESYTVLSMRTDLILQGGGSGGKKPLPFKRNLLGCALKAQQELTGDVSVRRGGYARKYSQQKREHNVFKELQVDNVAEAFMSGMRGKGKI